MRLSILVVSRTAELLSRLSNTLIDATDLLAEDVEILVSWNGSRAEEQRIDNASPYPIRITSRDQYHFASNVNTLAEQAGGDLLLILNDDVLLDSGSIDAAIRCLESTPNAGLVGARLRSSDGMVSHDGVGFTNDHSAYNLFEGLIPISSPELRVDPVLSPAVIGALMLIRRRDFLAIRFDESCQVHGEDTTLCFALRQTTGLDVLVCPACSGIHDPSTTRSLISGQDGNITDIDNLRARRRLFLQQASDVELRKELWCATREAHVLRSLTHVDEDVLHWRNEVHRLQLHRLRLEQDIRQFRQDGAQA